MANDLLCKGKACFNQRQLSQLVIDKQNSILIRYDVWEKEEQTRTEKSSLREPNTRNSSNCMCNLNLASNLMHMPTATAYCIMS
jgi:hypothetical protein